MQKNLMQAFKDVKNSIPVKWQYQYDNSNFLENLTIDLQKAIKLDHAACTLTSGYFVRLHYFLKEQKIRIDINKNLLCEMEEATLNHYSKLLSDLNKQIVKLHDSLLGKSDLK